MYIIMDVFHNGSPQNDNVLLFFDVHRVDGDKPPDIDYREEHYILKTTLDLEKQNAEKREAETKQLKLQIKCLEKKVIKEKDRYQATVPRLETTIRHLTIDSENVESIKKELKEAKNKLKATEFYKILMNNSDQPEKQLKEYLCKNGSLDSEKFFQLQRSQIKDLTEKRRESAREVEQLKAENNALKRKAKEDASVIKTLKSSVLELRDRANVETPITNKRLRAVLDSETPPPAKRVSLGFDDSSQLIDGDLSYFKKKENKTPPEPAMKPSTSSAPFSFDDDDDDEEYFRTPKIASNAKKVEEKPKEVSEDSFDFDIVVPQSIINRIPSKSTGNVLKVKPMIPKFAKDAQVKKQTPKLSFEDSFDDFLQQQLIIKNLSKTKAIVLTEKPKNTIESSIKRYRSENILPKKTDQALSKNAIISSFFTKTTSSNSYPQKEYVTID
uniref:RING-type domain-containing protein n=1 Tax=Caenorhabditis tropicalis TaxID=1561998 RepID=A0A1I7TG65_9PELO